MSKLFTQMGFVVSERITGSYISNVLLFINHRANLWLSRGFHIEWIQTGSNVTHQQTEVKQQIDPYFGPSRFIQIASALLQLPQPCRQSESQIIRRHRSLSSSVSVSPPCWLSDLKWISYLFVGLLSHFMAWGCSVVASVHWWGVWSIRTIIIYKLT